MSKQQLFIPDRIKVGFQKRNDTYSKKLSYVIYFDQKNILRKEKSWESWRHKDIEPVEFKNEPTEGFVLNKNVGGYKSNWNYRSAHIRVYDPRDFEFEISVENLLFILKECDCNKGKGLEGQFVYSWQGTELVLLPVNSEDYKNSQQFTNLQDKIVKAKELIKGASYITKRQEVLTFLGKFDYYYIIGSHNNKKKFGPKFIFYNGKTFIALNNLKSIATIQSDLVTSDYAELVDLYYKSPEGSKVVKLYLKDKQIGNEPRYWAYQEGDSFIHCTSYTDIANHVSYIEKRIKSSLNDGYIVSTYMRETVKNPSYINVSGYPYYSDFRGIWVEPTNKELWALLESDSEYQVRGYSFVTNK